MPNEEFSEVANRRILELRRMLWRLYTIHEFPRDPRFPNWKTTPAGQQILAELLSVQEVMDLLEESVG